VNVAKRAPGLAYRIEETLVARMIITSHIVWDKDVVTISADQVMAAGRGKEQSPTLNEAKEFLVNIIGSDGKLVDEIKDEAKDAGLSWATIRRAKGDLKLISYRESFTGPWRWKRP
jgi:hypothetical protein